ncbi:AEC family transporter [Vibrio sp. ZSDZ65]|uniref:AEC family transporter n=1 Tax=Vibrio qingdaonensis TaxID=2829491 RepID=A0A9X3CM12_9VIBR|nr:AEC family transporter [Vibrio qingdaonensis]MCW8345868.1 AEC family transporter [Vibrio qingdaonensis]
MEQAKLMSWIFLGFFIAKTVPQVTQVRVDWIRSFAFSYLTPSLFFSSIYRADLNLLPSLSVIATYGVCVGTLFFGLRHSLMKNKLNTAASSNIKAISAIYPNAVGVGVPLIFTLYGAEAELILMGIVVTNLLVVLPLFNVLMIHSGESGFYSYRKVATDPILIAIVSGLLLNLWGMTLSPWVVNGLSAVGWVALPVILCVLGASLSFYQLRSLAKEKVLSLLLVKILFFPLLVLLIANYVIGLSVLETQVLVLLSSLPTGINVYLLSERYHVAKQATASVILFTTLFSLLSLLGWERVVGYIVT